MVKKSFAEFAFMLSVLLYAATPSSGQRGAPVALPDGAGKDMVTFLEWHADTLFKKGS